MEKTIQFNDIVLIVTEKEAIDLLKIRNFFVQNKDMYKFIKIPHILKKIESGVVPEFKKHKSLQKLINESL